MLDPLVKKLKRVREAHKMSQEDLEDCMGLVRDQYRHIEKGRRRPPKLEDGLAKWVKRFEDCVQVTRAEHDDIVETLSRCILMELSVLLDDPPGQSP